MTSKKNARGAKPAPTLTAGPKTKSSRAKARSAPISKADVIVSLLGRPSGASAAELVRATGWQIHSVRGFLSGTLKKKRGLAVLADRSSGEIRYRLTGAKA
jgi:hypothetical protein